MGARGEEGLLSSASGGRPTACNCVFFTQSVSQPSPFCFSALGFVQSVVSALFVHTAWPRRPPCSPLSSNMRARRKRHTDSLKFSFIDGENSGVVDAARCSRRGRPDEAGVLMSKMVV